MTRRKWTPILECDNEETGEHECWACEVDSPKYGKYIWITKCSDTEYDVEYIGKLGGREEVIVLMTCKSLSSAKRWVAMYIK